uniref:Uncharacterized protein n=1 Tax=Plectus sambesii TaxID=2011161 RepID=A0A914WK29_9BILA
MPQSEQYIKHARKQDCPTPNDKPGEKDIRMRQKSEPLGYQSDAANKHLEGVRKRSGIIVLHSSSIQALPETLTAKRRSQRIMWLILLIVANLACMIHLYYLLCTFIVSPNAFSIAYERKDELTMPRVIVCQPTTRLLDANALQNISKEYFYALELGMGLVNHNDLQHYIFDVDLRQVYINYEQILKDYGNISVAYHDFYLKYGRKCGAIFNDCNILQQEVNCCDVFELVFTMNGYCWVSRENSLKARGLESMASFRFKLQFEGVTRPHFLPENRDDKEPYFFGLMERLDQSVVLAENWIVYSHERVSIQMTQKHRKMMSYPEKCADPGRELKYFREYYEPNCGWEKVLFNNLHILLNESTCELPLVELLKPGYFVQQPCTLKEIMYLFNYSDDCPVQSWMLDLLSAASNSSIQAMLESKCAWENLSQNITLPPCTINHLRNSALPPAAKELVEQQFNICNRMPATLLDIFGKLQNLHNFTDESDCIPFCETYSHIYRKDSVISSDLVKWTDASIVIKYTTKVVELVEEEPRQSLAEYIAMVGGNFGLWNGASIISFTHFGALLIRCLGFNPFR